MWINGLSLLNIFLNNIGGGTENTLSKCADDTKLCGAVTMLESKDAMESNPDRLERCVHVNLRKINKDRDNILQMGQGNPKH